MAESAHDLLAADRVLGGYRVVRRLGKGGMAEVYEVESVKTGAAYALKVFVCAQNNRDFLERRFLAEGRLLAKLHHPRIVRVHDFGFTEPEGIPYFVMDLVLDASGRPCSLREALARGQVDEPRILSWYEDLREALAYVHGKGVVHRDLSLENALLGPDGRAVLSDFGVSKVIDRDLRAELEMTRITRMTDGLPVMGKSFYLAPEVRAGKPASAASDYYALGVLLFYLLEQVWYTPGARMDDLLAFFDPRWPGVFAALLEPDPAVRTCPALPPPAPEPAVSSCACSARVWAALLAAVALPALGLGVWNVRVWLQDRARVAQVARLSPLFSVGGDGFTADDARDTAWVVRGLLEGGLREGKSPGRMSDVLDNLDYRDNTTPFNAALENWFRQTRFLLAVEAGKWDRAAECFEEDFPPGVKERLRNAVPPERRKDFPSDEREENP